MVTAQALGWGTGWPDCQRDRCIWVTAGGIRLLVRAEVAPIFKGFCDELVQRGYPLGDVADDWGFACRQIRGSTQPSNHSWGLAIDLNATANPMGSRATNFPAWAIELGERKYGLTWGGRYSTRPDPMHWEWTKTVDAAAWLIAALAALPPDQQPPEPAPQEPKPVEDSMENVTIFKDSAGGFYYFDSRGPVFFAIAKVEEAQDWIGRGAHLLWAENATINNAAASAGVTLNL